MPVPSSAFMMPRCRQATSVRGVPVVRLMRGLPLVSKLLYRPAMNAAVADLDGPLWVLLNDGHWPPEAPSLRIGDGSVIEGNTGAVNATFTLTLVCHIVPGEHPMVGSPVEVKFSAMGM